MAKHVNCTNGFVDIHQHFLYGIDDGAQTYDEMTEMLSIAYREGVRTIIATPHMTPGVTPYNTELLEYRLNEAQEYCSLMGFQMRLFSGAEILYTPTIENVLMERTLPTLAGTRYILIEFAPHLAYREIKHAVASINRYGYLPILAHVERYRCFRRKPGLLFQLRQRYMAHYQVNCGTLLGENGFWAKRFAWHILRDGTLDYIASDAHHTSTRNCQMAKAYQLIQKRMGSYRADQLMKVNDFANLHKEDGIENEQEKAKSLWP